jgi:hypothetical protein
MFCRGPDLNLLSSELPFVTDSMWTQVQVIPSLASHMKTNKKAWQSFMESQDVETPIKLPPFENLLAVKVLKPEVL